MAEIPEALNRVAYQWKRNQWMVDPRSYLSEFDDVEIRSPIFQLGFQGGGTTILARMVRRHPEIVSVTGNHKYWSGAGEMHTVLGLILPQILTGTTWKPPEPEHETFEPPRSWTYAVDDLIDAYRATEEDANTAVVERFRRLVRMCISRHGPEGTERFFDKSQVYTVKAGLIGEILDGCDPKFYILAMNPYVACYKSAIGRVEDMDRLSDKLTLDERLELCIQHWLNSIQAARKDVGDGLHVVRYENLVREPEKVLRGLCSFLDLDFRDRMVPGPEDDIPVGTRFPERWYPLKIGRTESYLDRLQEDLSDDQIQQLVDRIGPLARELGYEHPV
jgi:hypothetical protein